MAPQLFSTGELRGAIESLKISSKSLNDAVENQPESLELYKALRDSCIQRFEFCVELSWKTAVKALGLEIKSPTVAIRDMARSDLISDTTLWFDLLNARNRTSHTYDEDIAQEVFLITQNAIQHFEELLIKIEQVLK